MQRDYKWRTCSPCEAHSSIHGAFIFVYVSDKMFCSISPVLWIKHLSRGTKTTAARCWISEYEVTDYGRRGVVSHDHIYSIVESVLGFETEFKRGIVGS